MTLKSVNDVRHVPSFNRLIQGVSDSIRWKSIGPTREALNEEEIQEVEGALGAAECAITSAVMGLELVTKFLYMADEHENGNVNIVNVAELVSLLGKVIEGSDRVFRDASYSLQHHYMLKAGEAA